MIVQPTSLIFLSARDFLENFSQNVFQLIVDESTSKNKYNFYRVRALYIGKKFYIHLKIDNNSPLVFLQDEEGKVTIQLGLEAYPQLRLVAQKMLEKTKEVFPKLQWKDEIESFKYGTLNVKLPVNTSRNVWTYAKYQASPGFSTIQMDTLFHIEETDTTQIATQLGRFKHVIRSPLEPLHAPREKRQKTEHGSDEESKKEKETTEALSKVVETN